MALFLFIILGLMPNKKAGRKDIAFCPPVILFS